MGKEDSKEIDDSKSRDKGTKRKIAYFAITLFIVFLLAFYFFSSQKEVIPQDYEKSATCIEVEKQLNNKYGDQANCSCYRDPDMEEKADVPQKVKEKADLYYINCQFPEGEESYSIWLVKGTNKTINNSLIS